MSTFDAQVTFCRTRDLDATAHFYEQVLGLPLALDQGVCRIYEAAPGAFLGFCARADAPRPEGVILTLVSDDVDGWHERLVERGARPEHAPAHHESFRIYHFFVRDPSGYLVEIQRFDDPAWQRGR